MAETELTNDVTAPGTNGTTGQDFTWSAADNANGNKVDHNGNVLVLARNDDGSPQTVTITSTTDPWGRSGTISAYSLGAGEYACFGPFRGPGWQNADGHLYLTASDANVNFAVIQL